MLGKVAGDANTMPKSLRDAAHREHEADSQQRRKLRTIVCYWLIGLLIFEVVGMFWMVICQGVKWIELNEVTFGLLCTGVLIQTVLQLPNDRHPSIPGRGEGFLKVGRARQSSID